MIPIDSYRLYQAERDKSRAEIRRAEDSAGRLSATLAGLRPGRRGRRAGQTLPGRPTGQIRACATMTRSPSKVTAGPPCR